MLLWPCTYIKQISLCIYIIYLLHFLFTFFNVNEISMIHFTPFSLLFYRYTVTIWLSKISCIQYGFNVNNYTSCTSRTCIIIHIMIDRPRHLIIAGSGPFPPQYLWASVLISCLYGLPSLSMPVTVCLNIPAKQTICYL